MTMYFAWRIEGGSFWLGVAVVTVDGVMVGRRMTLGLVCSTAVAQTLHKPMGEYHVNF